MTLPYWLNPAHEWTDSDEARHPHPKTSADFVLKCATALTGLGMNIFDIVSTCTSVCVLNGAGERYRANNLTGVKVTRDYAGRWYSIGDVYYKAYNSYHDFFQDLRAVPESNDPEMGKRVVATLAQRFLFAHDLFHGEVNGTWGPDSEEACKAFQAKFLLEETGQVGSLTMFKLAYPEKEYPSSPSVPVQELSPEPKVEENCSINETVSVDVEQSKELEQSVTDPAPALQPELLVEEQASLELPQELPPQDPKPLE